MKELFMNVWSVKVRGIHEIDIHEYMITNSYGYSWKSNSWIYDHSQLGVFTKYLFINIRLVTVRGIHEIVIYQYMMTNS